MIHHSSPSQLRSSILSLDSRQIYLPQQTAFFAVRGVHHDGHQYIEPLYHLGVREFIVEKAAWSGILAEKAKKWNTADFWVVESSIESLQDIARIHRKSFSIPVIGITGSNGKTTCKEWLATLLQSKFSVIKSPKSFNSQIGVPLSVWGIKSQHQLAIFEAGISKVGEMKKIERVIQPTWGIFTHFGEAHGQNFESDQQKLQEKLQLFTQVEKLVYRRKNAQHDPIKEGMQAINPQAELISWSTEDLPQSLFVYWKIGAHETHIRIKKPAQSEAFLDVRTELTDEAYLENLCHCLIMAHVAGLSTEEIQERTKWVRPISMRLEIKEGLRNNQIIDDSYNNDLDGLQLALPLLKKYEHKKRVLIISDFIETGIPAVELYPKIASLVQSQKIDQLIGVGDQLTKYQQAFQSIEVFYHTEDLLNSGILNQLSDAVILLKGARKFNFELITQALETKTHCTKLEVNLDALQSNLTYYKETIGQNTKLMVMVKAFAYGTGAIEIAQVLQQQGIDYLTVAYTDEGVQLRKNGIYSPIMVMNPQIGELDTLSNYALEPEVYSMAMLEAIDEYCHAHNKSIKIHIKLDTGMKRLGFSPDQCKELTHKIASMPQVWVASILSHLVASESIKHQKFTEKQIQLFDKMTQKIIQTLGYTPLRHIANSAAIKNYPNSRYEMVRLGISLYGISGNKEEKKSLENVLTLKTYISQIKEIKKNETIGYGRKGKLKTNGRIATLALGYADGYARSLGMGKGLFEINGYLCPTVGAICMDMCMVDISHVPLVKEGDEAIAFGGKIQLTELAHQAKTIPYELMTNISERVKRVYVKN
ncbi:bifunctional UDP-N-acetylmuramoyl-tripeptide:D-alanyl-D-alanine ligase/alanine racemase [Aquirufa rosea]|uniref:Alanine racemase n=1 Tax=Aquirufa rosea TaxID=2509241 RepID=A0A4Q1BY79_9BACT|nr:bifunctional UDP-N-acetylmuramoyl-tripeptide:D-alanyl-D-alanine ligase/alanine racemase [Aquirufa rosea]RXK47672.1 bifunctional UDP-N-acetylmuramoyl-tripeptide:D-alanyl-D-alanine ligase/alanine racemase [Aquirufa rosea]